MTDPIRLSSTAKVVAAVIILALATWAESDDRAAPTLEVSNQRILPENYIYVWCFDGLKREKEQLIAPKKVVRIQVGSGGRNDSSSKKLPYLCTGTFTKFYGMGALPYHIYDSKRNGDVSGCRVMANETSFYRWNGEKRGWDIIPPSPWLG